MNDLNLASEKMRTTDRVLVLSKKEGENTKNSIGLIDNRLFTGENKLHCKMDFQTLLWSFKYEQGGLPEPLKEKFTSFRAAMKHAENYFSRRNILIQEVLD